MALKEKAEAYFSSLNSMANRICVDMQETKLSYESLWQTLSYEEQQQILNQSIVKPEISLKYPLMKEKEPNKEFAVKMIVDDNYAYRDEHSGPFSFRTGSQRDLNLFPKKVCTKKPKPKVVIPTKAIIPIVVQQTAVLLQDNNIDTEDDGDSNSLTHILPRTGLDLLDNW